MPKSEQSPVRIPVSLNSETIYEDSIPIIQKIRPQWFESSSSSPTESGEGETCNNNNNGLIKMKVFSGGITNKLVGFFVEGNPEDIVIVKLYGEKTEMLIDRNKEVETMELLHEKISGPKLYAIFENGIAYEYSPGVTLDVDSCRDEKVYSLVAREMARMHSLVPIESTSESGIWKMLKNFNNLVKQVFDENPELKSKLENLGISKAWCTSAIEELETACAKENMPIVFCHNDLLLGNIIYDERKSKISFIDFEYAAANFAPFDIANHFNEFAGVDDADFSRCPDEEFMRRWLVPYLQNFSPSSSTSSLDVNLLFRWVQLCLPMSHLMWILWAIYQACYSQIDFDFVDYVSIRLPEYKKGMQVVRSLSS